MPSSVLTPARPAEPAESSFVVGCLLGFVLSAAVAYALGLLLMKL